MRPFAEPEPLRPSRPFVALVLDLLREHRRAWLLNWTAVVVLAAAVSLVLPKWYVATATLLPPSSESDLSFNFSMLLRGGDLSRGALPRTTSPEDIFTAILGSRALSRAAVRKFDLAGEYHVKLESQAIAEFANHLHVGTTREGVVFISVEDHSAERAAGIANFLVDDLDRFNKDVRMTAGKSARLFVERRLRETELALRKAEDNLKALGVRDALPITSGSADAAAGTGVMAQRIAIQVRLETLLQTQSETSEEVRRVRTELDALDRELRRLPQSGTEAARLLREVKIQDQVYTLLTQQFEEAKVREHKDTPTVQVLDRAEAPDRKARPKRGLIVVAAALIGLIESTAWVLYLERRRVLAWMPGTRSTS